jgi:two-component system, HptB-dependent secretion and biofilm response regulator
VTLSLKILIVDDTLTNIVPLQAVARKLGHEVVTARDGIEAVERFREASPDLVFMDIMMPGQSGIDAVREIRTLPIDRWVPVIMYSALDGLSDILAGLEAGADDYLVKPANLQLVRAKIAAYARILALQDETRRQSSELAAWRADAEEQSQLGQYIIGRLLDSEGLRDPMVRWLNTPAQSFSGDLVCAARGPGDTLYVMLADAAGHGLSAALTALPLTQVFQGMAQKGFPIHTIAEELNSKLKAFLPIDRFVAATLASIDTRNQTIEVWNGGTPEVLFIDEQGDVAMRWPSRHPPLGIMPTSLFSGTTDTVNYQQAGELLMYSDGIIEAENVAGERLGMAGLERLLQGVPPGERLRAIEDGVTSQLAGQIEHDDLSTLIVTVPLERRTAPRLASAQQQSEQLEERVSEWRLDLYWGAEQLRSVDVVPAVLGFANQIKILQRHQGQMFLIVSELFNNALDHGLLGLDSRTKNEEGGFERYLEERELRLARLEEGRIEMSFHLHPREDRAVLDIRLRDSGPGFDYVAYMGTVGQEADASLTHGRGVRLVKTLCDTLEYSENGNAVFARYLL